MNFLIASDLHGSLLFTEKIIDKIDIYHPEKVILLGDLYYHGVRNPLPAGYDPRKVNALLNQYASKLLVVKGNCDSEVDQMVSSFPMVESALLYAFGREMFFTHGHNIDFDDPIVQNVDIFFCGHTHVGELVCQGRRIKANPGSVSLPKNKFHSYIYMDEKEIALRNLLDDSTIEYVQF